MGNMKIAILNLFANEVVVKCNMFIREWNTGFEQRLVTPTLS